MKKSLKIFAVLLSLLILSAAAGCLYLRAVIPAEVQVRTGESLSFARTSLLTVHTGQASAAYTVDANANAGGYSAHIRLFGILPVKTVWVKEASQQEVAVSGAPFGIKLYSDGVMIVGFQDIATATGYQNPAKAAGLRMGDTIYKIDGASVTDNAQVQQAVEKSGGQPLTVQYARKQEKKQCVVVPVPEKETGVYRIGMRVRDSTAGIGTMTFVCEEDGAFAGLGHPVTDVDTGEDIALLSGQIVPVEITEYTQSSSGLPGELKGVLSSLAVGEIAQNNAAGIFGRLYGRENPFAGEKMAVALRQEVTPGAATVLCCIEGSQPQSYTAQIEHIRYSQENVTKNMIIRITDSRLLEQTGGIVQGMSGSPVIQNHRLVGAITHVLVNDPTRGYAIFAENMVSAMCAESSE